MARVSRLLNRLLRGLSGVLAERGRARAPGAVIQQFGAVPYRVVDGEFVFLAITSRRSRQWIFPKGGPAEGLSPTESAAEEAFEEAGVRGTVGATPVGNYRAFKPGSAGTTALSVAMFPLEVETEFDDWPEKSERQRRWVTLSEARKLLSEPDLAAMAEKIAGPGDRSSPG